MEVGIIGVGLMGHGIAKNIAGREGFQLAILDHPGNQPVEDLIALGVRLHDTPAQVARDADLIILCVTGAPQVESVMESESGILSALRPGAIIVDCSTSLPATTVAMAGKVAALGGAFLDAPMTRTAAHAAAGTLNLLVGGDGDILEKAMPVLSTFTERVDHVGPVGSGHRLKLLHNYVSVGSMALIAEAAAQAADAHVPPGLFVDTLASGGGGGVALQRMTPFLLEGDPSTIPFFISNALKDIRYFDQMASQMGAPVPIAKGIAEAIEALVADGHGEAFVPEMAKWMRVRRPED